MAYSDKSICDLLAPLGDGYCYLRFFEHDETNDLTQIRRHFGPFPDIDEVRQYYQSLGYEKMRIPTAGLVGHVSRRCATTDNWLLLSMNNVVVGGNGYCYLEFFRVYNSLRPGTFHYRQVRRELGRYPALRRVLSTLLSKVEDDFYIPSPVWVTPSLMHVDRNGPPILFTQLLSAYALSNIRIGASENRCYVDDRMARTRKMVELSTVCKMAGVDRNEILTAACKNTLNDILRKPEVLQPLMDNNFSLAPAERLELPYYLEVDSATELTSSFRELGVVLGNKVNHAHGVAAAVRDCSEEYMIRILGYDKNLPARDLNGRVQLLDVGSNLVRHVARGRTNIHCCSPIIDYRDSKRSTEQVEALDRMVMKGQITPETRNRYLDKRGNDHRCYNKAQDCRVPAKKGMIVQAAYDFSYDDYCDIFDAHDLDIVLSAVNFSPDMLHADHGLLPSLRGSWSITDGRISFSFINDSSLNYTHDYKNLMDTLTRQCYVTKKGVVYIAERVTCRMNTLFIKYTACRDKPMINRVELSHNVWLESKDELILSGWEYDNDMYAESKFSTKDNPVIGFKRKIVPIPQSLFDLVYGHCCRCGDKSFNLNEVYSAALSFNSRFTINGMEMKTVRRMSTPDLIWAVCMIYAMAYKDRFAAGKTIERFVKDQKDTRDRRTLGFRGLYSAFYGWFRSRSVLDNVCLTWNEFVKACGNYSSFGSLDFELLNSCKVMTYSEVLDIIAAPPKDNYFLDLRVSEVRFKSETAEMVGKHTIEVIRDRFGGTEDHCKVPDKVYEDSCSGVVSPLPVSNTRYKSAIKKIYSVGKSEVSFTSDSWRDQKRRIQKPLVCDASVVLPMPADGHCFFHAVAYGTGHSVAEVRKMIWEAASEDVRRANPHMLLMDGSRKAWGSTDILLIASKLFGYRVCLHYYEDNKDVVITDAFSGCREGPIRHFRLRTTGGDIRTGRPNTGGHVDLLIGPDQDVKVLKTGKESSFESFKKEKGLELGEFRIDQPTGNYWNAIYDYIHKNRLSVYCETADLLTLNMYLNRSAYKLAEIISVFELTLNGPILDLCGAPGGFLEVFNDLEIHDVDTVSLVDKYCKTYGYNKIIKSIFEFDAIRKYPFVTADGAVEDSYLKDDIFVRELRVAVDSLLPGGCLVIKHNNYFQLIEKMSEYDGLLHFRDVSIYKPRLSREGNSECYLVCQDFSPESLATLNLNDLSLKRMIDGINRYFSRQEPLKGMELLSVVKQLTDSVIPAEKWKFAINQNLWRVAGGFHDSEDEGCICADCLRSLTASAFEMAEIRNADLESLTTSTDTDDGAPLLRRISHLKDKSCSETLLNLIAPRRPRSRFVNIGNAIAIASNQIGKKLHDLQNSGPVIEAATAIRRRVVPLVKPYVDESEIRICETKDALNRAVESGLQHVDAGKVVAKKPKQKTMKKLHKLWERISPGTAPLFVSAPNDAVDFVKPGASTTVLPDNRKVSLTSYGYSGTQSRTVTGALFNPEKQRMSDHKVEVIKLTHPQLKVVGHYVPDEEVHALGTKDDIKGTVSEEELGDSAETDSLSTELTDVDTVVSPADVTESDEITPFDSVSCIGSHVTGAGEAEASSVVSDACASSVVSSAIRRLVSPDKSVKVFTYQEFLSALPRSTSINEDKLTVSWFGNFPAGCRVAVSFGTVWRAVSGKRIVIGQAMKDLLGTAADVMKSHFARWNKIEKTGYFRLIDGVYQVVLYDVTAAAAFVRFMNEASHQSGLTRIAMDFSVGLNILTLNEWLGKTDLLVALFNVRDERYDVLLETPKTVEVPKAFPKITCEEMGVAGPQYLPGSAATVNYINSMVEFKHLTAASDNFNFSKLLEVYNQTVFDDCAPSSAALDSLLRKGMNIYDNTLHCYLLPTSRRYDYGVCPEGFVPRKKELQNVFPFEDTGRGDFVTDCRYVLVSRRTEKMLNQKILKTLNEIDEMTVTPPKFTWVNGPPGCGKTSYILNEHNPPRRDSTLNSDIVVSLTIAGKEEMVSRMKGKLGKQCPGDREMSQHYRTLASVLVNGTEKYFKRMFIDEHLMSHFGAVAYAAAILRVDEIIALGDINQIPYVDRDNIFPLRYHHAKVFANVSRELTCSYRCPIDVCYALRRYYKGIHTMNANSVSMRRERYSGSVIPTDLKNTLYLTHLQADKDKLILDGYGKAPGSKVLTVHEAQGLTFQNTVCVRITSKAVDIFDDEAYAIVAISRHTCNFTYYSDVDDAITQMMNINQNDAELVNWNERQKLGSRVAGGADYFPSEVIFTPKVYRPLNEELVKNLPHATHELRREKVLTEEIGFEGKRQVIRPNRDSDVDYLQTWYDDKMPGVSSVTTVHDQEIIEYSDISIPLDKITLDISKGPLKVEKFDKLKPKLRTSINALRKPSQKESVLGAAKRNLNAPLLQNELDGEKIGDLLFENFVRSAIAPEARELFDSFQSDVVHIDPRITDDWLAKRPPSMRKCIISDVPMHLRRYSDYTFMVKSAVKPSMDKGCTSKYAAVQTIAYTDKPENAIFCPAMMILAERLVSVLVKKILVAAGLSNTEYENTLNKRLWASMLKLLKSIENDFAKFDKAQREAILRFEYRLLIALGLSHELAAIWVECHRKSLIRDKKNGVRFITEYQRKSGDAWTFWGNTLCTLAVMLAVYDIDDIEFLTVAGDDSLILLKNAEKYETLRPSGMISNLFNLESKLLTRYNVPYFCSKFLIVVNDWIYVVPDLLKVVTKLGRHDMSDYIHVEEYRVSCLDTLDPLFNTLISGELSEGIRERYGGLVYDVSKVLSVLYTLVSDAEKFKELYRFEDWMKLCSDPSARRLDI